MQEVVMSLETIINRNIAKIEQALGHKERFETLDQAVDTLVSRPVQEDYSKKPENWHQFLWQVSASGGLLPTAASSVACLGHCLTQGWVKPSLRGWYVLTEEGKGALAQLGPPKW